MEIFLDSTKLKIVWTKITTFFKQHGDMEIHFKKFYFFVIIPGDTI